MSLIPFTFPFLFFLFFLPFSLLGGQQSTIASYLLFVLLSISSSLFFISSFFLFSSPNERVRSWDWESGETERWDRVRAERLKERSKPDPPVDDAGEATMADLLGAISGEFSGGPSSDFRRARWPKNPWKPETHWTRERDPWPERPKDPILYGRFPTATRFPVARSRFPANLRRSSVWFPAIHPCDRSHCFDGFLWKSP